MPNKYILVSGKSLNVYTNARACVRAPNGHNSTYLLTTYHDTPRTPSLTAGQACGKILLQAHN